MVSRAIACGCLRALAMILGSAALALSLAAASVEEGWQVVPVRLKGQPVDLSNAAAIRLDAAGRIWILERLENRTNSSSRILLLDVNGTGEASLFADQLPLASSMEWSVGGLYLAAPPALLFLPDREGGSRVTPPVVAVKGLGEYGKRDTVPDLRWGPDGWLYLLFNTRERASLSLPGEESSLTVNSGVLRYHPRSRSIEAYSDGPSDLRSLAFHERGSILVSTGSANPLFEILPGSTYLASDAYPRPLNPLADRFPSICSASWGRIVPGRLHLIDLGRGGNDGVTAFLTLSNAPPLRVSLKEGGGHLTASSEGSASAQAWQQGLSSEVLEQGMDGSLWRIASGKLLVHRSSVSADLGRSSPNLISLGTEECVQLLGSTNAGQRSMARRILQDRHDPQTLTPLLKLWGGDLQESARLETLWTLASLAPGSQEWLSQALVHRFRSVRSAAIRVLGEQGNASPEGIAILATRAREVEPRVRMEVAIALRRWMIGGRFQDGRQRASGDLSHYVAALEPLIQTSVLTDRSWVEPLIWSAWEPLMLADPKLAFSLLSKLGGGGLPVTGDLMTRTVRRIFATRDSSEVSFVLERLGALAAESPGLCARGLEGVMLGQKGSKQWTGHKGIRRLLSQLSESGNDELGRVAQQVDAMCGNPAAQAVILARINEVNATPEDRLKAIAFARAAPSEGGRAALIQLLSAGSEELLGESALAALQEMGRADDGKALVHRWKQLAASLRPSVGEAMAKKPEWAPALIDGLEARSISKGDLSPAATELLKTLPNLALRGRALAVLARLRD